MIPGVLEIPEKGTKDQGVFKALGLVHGDDLNGLGIAFQLDLSLIEFAAILGVGHCGSEPAQELGDVVAVFREGLLEKVAQLAKVGDPSVAVVSLCESGRDPFLAVHESKHGSGSALGEEIRPGAELFQFSVVVIRKVPQLRVSAPHQSGRESREAEHLPARILQRNQDGKQVGCLLGGHDIVTGGTNGGDSPLLQSRFNLRGLISCADKNGKVTGAHCFGLLLGGVPDGGPSLKETQDLRCSLSCNAFVTVLLVGIGLAVLRYPELDPGGIGAVSI